MPKCRGEKKKDLEPRHTAERILNLSKAHVQEQAGWSVTHQCTNNTDTVPKY